MTQERSEEVERLYRAALGQDRSQRADFLKRVCPDEALRHNVEALLTRLPESGIYPETRAGDGTDNPALPGFAIDRIGPYRLVRMLGAGGMGEVFEAEQKSPVRRRVAIKVIKLGFDTRQIISRFEAERQALALMNHANVARVLDAGATDAGRPYFVMELVHGVPITEYCDFNRLATLQRLELFLQVCEGAQHAHQKGIIHRDLKPSNILVELQDQTPIAKIIDFGLAKTFAAPLTEQSAATQFGQLIGTPEYMSPEQAEMSRLDVDTRTDIYALGVILYQLLTGYLPVDASEFRRGSLEDIRSTLREKDPLRPSTRVTQLSPGAAKPPSEGRDQRGLARELRGDLDWIVLKAIHKDRTQRYASCSELAADIKRHLRHEPVLAGPPAASYRIRKFVRRHRLAFATGSIVLFALIAGFVGTTLGLIRARAAEIRAQEEAETANRVTDFLVQSFELSDPNEARGNSITAREILERGSARVRNSLSDQPSVQARLMHTIGRVYTNLGLYDNARPMLEEALRKRRAGLGTPQQLARTLNDLAWLYRAEGKRAEAEPLTREAIQALEPLVGPDSPELAFSLTMRGTLLRDLNRFDEARPLLERSLRIRETALGPDHVDVGWSAYHLGWLLKLTGKPREAQQQYERALRLFEKGLGPDSPTVGWCLNDLAIVRSELGEFDASRELYLRALAIQERVLGPTHPDVASVLNNLGGLAYRAGDYKEAQQYYARTMEIRSKTLGPRHPDLAGVYHNLGLLARVNGDLDSSSRYLERALSIFEDSGTSETLSVANTLGEMALLSVRKGERAAADRSYRRAVTLMTRTVGSDHPDLEYFQSAYSAAIGNVEEALNHLERAVQLGFRQPLRGDPDLASLSASPRFAVLVERAAKP